MSGRSNRKECLRCNWSSNQGFKGHIDTCPKKTLPYKGFVYLEGKKKGQVKFKFTGPTKGGFGELTCKGVPLKQANYSAPRRAFSLVMKHDCPDKATPENL
jgi:hypothetical protein